MNSDGVIAGERQQGDVRLEHEKLDAYLHVTRLTPQAIAGIKISSFANHTSGVCRLHRHLPTESHALHQYNSFVHFTAGFCRCSIHLRKHSPRLCSGADAVSRFDLITIKNSLVESTKI